MKLNIGRRNAAILLIAFGLAACTSAKTSTFTLSAVPPQGTQPSGRALRPPVEVGEVAIPATIDRDSIVLTAPSDRLEVLPNSVWGAPIRQLVRRALSDDLTQRLPPNSVLSPGTPAPRHGLRIITVSIQQFSGGTDGRVVLDANWTIAHSGSQPAGMPSHARITVNAGQGTPAAIVPAMSKALGELSDRIARALD